MFCIKFRKIWFSGFKEEVIMWNVYKWMDGEIYRWMDIRWLEKFYYNGGLIFILLSKMFMSYLKFILFIIDNIFKMVIMFY